MNYGSRIQSQVIKHLVNGVKEGTRSFDERTGRFLEKDGGWSVTHQDRIYALAFLYTTRTRNNSHYGKKKILNMIARGGDALCDWMNPDGSFVFIKIDGSRWGDIYMCWSMYHWLETYDLIQSHLDPKRRRRWEKHLRKTYFGIADKFKRTGFHIHNMPSWLAMGMVRAGQIFDEPRLIEEGTEYCRTVAKSQHADGYWPEGYGPTTIYNPVYVHSLGLYYRFTKDRTILSVLKRATTFHRAFTYPDGRSCETVDGRVKFHPNISPMGLVGFSATPEGRGLVELLLEASTGPGRGALSSYLVSLCRHGFDGPVIPTCQKKRSFATNHHSRGLVRRKGPWFICLSGYVTPPAHIHEHLLSRWIMDRQQHVSVWHEDFGLVIGGGNSLGQPERSTFVVCPGDGPWRHIADHARVSLDARSGDSVALRYGKTHTRLRVRIVSSHKIELTFTAPRLTNGNIIAGFIMPCVNTPPSFIDSKGKPPIPFDPSSEIIREWTDPSPRKRWFEMDRIRVWVPEMGSIRWPQYPFNPYAIDNAAPPEQAALHVYTPLNKTQKEKRFILEIRK